MRAFSILGEGSFLFKLFVLRYFDDMWVQVLDNF